MKHTSKMMILTYPNEMREAGRLGFPLAHMAYRCGAGHHLYRIASPVMPSTGIMVIGEDGYDGKGDAMVFCREVLRECTTKNFRGIVLDFTSMPTATTVKIITILEEQALKRQWDFFVPEPYANYTKKGKILVSSALSGGKLSSRLDEVVERYGASRICLSLDPICEEFSLPAPTGSGITLTKEELDDRKKKWDPSVFFSEDLCAYYFTYMSREGGAHFVLYDDSGSLQKKLALGEEKGISHFAMLYPRCKGFLQGMFPEN